MTKINVLTLDDLSQENIDGFFPVLIDIYNPDISWTPEEIEFYKQSNSHIRLVCDDNTVVYKGKTFLPCSFNFQPPETDGGKIGNATITITALDSRVRKLLRDIKISSELEILATFAKKEKDTKGFTYSFYPLKNMRFEMSSATMSKVSATFNLVFDSALDQVVPYDIATPERVPSTKG